jgi:hypothetical protein
MIIKNYNDILSSGKENLQQIFDNFTNELGFMAETDQLNINSAEEHMLKAVKMFKKYLVLLMGNLFSNVEMNESNKIYKEGIRYKLLKKNAHISILTLLGKIDIERDYYFSYSKGEGFGIIDELLEIKKGHLMTNGMTETISYAAQKDGSFKEASESIDKYLDLDISSTTIQKISEGVGGVVFNQDMKEAERILLNNENVGNNFEVDIYREKAEKLFVFADGSMICMNEKNHWKEIKLGLVVNNKNVDYINMDNMKISEREYVSYLGNKDEFKKLLYSAVLKAGYHDDTEIICIGDGAKWIWNMFEELFPNCIKILDYYHFDENLYKYAKYVYQNDEIKIKKWTSKIKELAFENRSDDIIKEIQKIDIDLSNKPSDIPNLLTYITEKKDLIRYGYFKEKNYIIGSGAIESGNKLVLQRRLKQAGMHWSSNGAQYIAALRTKYKSKLWNKVIYTIENIHKAS